MLKTIKSLIFSQKPAEPESDIEKWQQDYDSKNHPESEKYFEAAKKLLEKYPINQWEFEPGFCHISPKIKHKKCPIEFTVTTHYKGGYVEYSESIGKMTYLHGRKIYEEFQPLFDKRKNKYEKSLEEKQQQFDTKLAAALS